MSLLLSTAIGLAATVGGGAALWVHKRKHNSFSRVRAARLFVFGWLGVICGALIVLPLTSFFWDLFILMTGIVIGWLVPTRVLNWLKEFLPRFSREADVALQNDD